MLRNVKVLHNYAHSAADLAESLKKDIIKGKIISQATIIALNKFILAANEAKDLTDIIETDSQKLN